MSGINHVPYSSVTRIARHITHNPIAKMSEEQTLTLEQAEKVIGPLRGILPFSLLGEAVDGISWPRGAPNILASLGKEKASMALEIERIVGEELEKLREHTLQEGLKKLRMGGSAPREFMTSYNDMINLNGVYSFELIVDHVKRTLNRMFVYTQLTECVLIGRGPTYSFNGGPVDAAAEIVHHTIFRMLQSIGYSISADSKGNSFFTRTHGNCSGLVPRRMIGVLASVYEAKKAKVLFDARGKDISIPGCSDALYILSQRIRSVQGRHSSARAVGPGYFLDVLARQCEERSRQTEQDASTVLAASTYALIWITKEVSERSHLYQVKPRHTIEQEGLEARRLVKDILLYVAGIESKMEEGRYLCDISIANPVLFAECLLAFSGDDLDTGIADLEVIGSRIASAMEILRQVTGEQPRDTTVDKP